MNTKKILSAMLAGVMLAGTAPSALAAGSIPYESPAVLMAASAAQSVGDPTFAASEATNILNKKASDLQENIKLGEMDVDSKTIAVTGTSKYVSGWKEFHGSDEAQQSGHYLALTITKPDSVTDVSKVKVTTQGAGEAKVHTSFFTEAEGKQETLVMRLDGIRANKQDKFTVTFDWDGDDGSNAAVTYTIDVSGVSFQSKNPATLDTNSILLAGLKDFAETPVTDLYDADSYKVTVDEVKADAVNTVKIEAKNLKEHTNAEKTAGHWVGFGVKAPAGAEKMKFAFSADETGLDTLSKATALEENIDGTSGAASKGIQFYTDAGAEKPKTYAAVQFVDADGNDLTGVYKFQVNLDGVTLYQESTDPDPQPSVGDPTFAASTAADILGKKASDLQDGIKLEAQAGSKTFIVSGTSKYVSGWKEFHGSDEAQQSGHYLALTITKPENADIQNLKVTTQGAGEAKVHTSFFTEAEGKQETLVMRLDGIRADKQDEFTVTFDWDGDTGSNEAVTYTFNIADVAFETPSVETKPDVQDDKVSTEVSKDSIDSAINDALATKPSDPEVETTVPVVIIDAVADNAVSAQSAVVTLPKDTVDALGSTQAQQQNLAVEIKTNVGTAKLDAKTIALLKNTGDAVSLNIEETVAAAVPDAASDEVYDVTFTGKDDKEIDVSNANITLTLRFSGLTDTQNKTIGWKDATKNGTIDAVTFEQNTAAANIYDATFTTTHLTQFFVQDKQTVVPPAGDLSVRWSDGRLGKIGVVTASQANTYLTIQVTKGGANAIYTVLPANKVAEISVPTGCTVQIWETKAAPQFQDGVIDQAQAIGYYSQNVTSATK